MIQEKINSLKPYFRAIKNTENYNILEMELKNTWVMEKGEGIEYQQRPTKENPNNLFTIFYSETRTFDQILEHVEVNIIKHNLEIEEKESLLRAKVEELKSVFESKSLDELNNLKFTTELDSLKLTNTKNNNTKSTKTKEKENGVAEKL